MAVNSCMVERGSTRPNANEGLIHSLWVSSFTSGHGNCQSGLLMRPNKSADMSGGQTGILSSKCSTTDVVLAGIRKKRI